MFELSLKVQRDRAIYFTLAGLQRLERKGLNASLLAGKLPNLGPLLEHGERFPFDRPFLLPALRDHLRGEPGRAAGAMLR